MTMGIAAKTRLSTAAVVQVVQPLFEPPATMNFLISPNPCFAANSVVASFMCYSKMKYLIHFDHINENNQNSNELANTIARTAAFVIGNLSKTYGSSGLSKNSFL